MEIEKILEKIEAITDELNGVEGEFKGLKQRYHHLDTRIGELYVERKKLVSELASACERKWSLYTNIKRKLSTKCTMVVF